jgi:hypothetical protein
MFFNSPTGYRPGLVAPQVGPQPNPLMQAQVQQPANGPTRGQGFHPGMPQGMMPPQASAPPTYMNPNAPSGGMGAHPGMTMPMRRPFPGQGSDMMPMGPMTNPGMAGGDPNGPMAQARPMMPGKPSPGGMMPMAGAGGQDGFGGVPMGGGGQPPGGQYAPMGGPDPRMALVQQLRARAGAGPSAQAANQQA